jgi:hypothetical protein
MKKKAKIAAPLKAEDLKDEEQDKELNQEIIRRPTKPKGRFQGRWNAGFNSRSNQPQLIRGNYKAQAEGVFRSADVGKVEAFRGSGHAKAAGKHVSADGLVSRRGHRRILPDYETDHNLWGERADQLAEAAKRELRGRNATVFEGLVLNPLLGGQRRSVADLAHQFGVPEARIHRIQNENKIRMIAALKGEPIPPPERRISNWAIEENRKMFEAVRRQLRDDSILLRTILSRNAAVERLFADAEAAWHQTPREYVCRTALLKGYWACLPGLIQRANDPALGDRRAPYLIGEALWESLPTCRVTCECGGGGPHVLWEYPSWWWYPQSEGGRFRTSGH